MSKLLVISEKDDLQIWLEDQGHEKDRAKYAVSMLRRIQPMYLITLNKVHMFLVREDVLWYSW